MKRWPLLTAACAVLVVASATTPTTTAAYRDITHARTEPLSAALTTSPELMSGLSTQARTVETGLGLSRDGGVYVWGRTDMSLSGGAPGAGTSRQPTRVPFPDGIEMRQVAGQIYDVNSLDHTGQVWGWGFHPDRHGSEGAQTGVPHPIRQGTAWNGNGPLLDDVAFISATEYAGAAIRNDGTIWHWGTPVGYGGNAGLGASRLPGLPDPSEPGNRPVYLKGAYTNFFTILENGDVYYWGGIGGNSLPPGVGNVGASATYLKVLAPWMKANLNPGMPYIVAADGGINMGAALLSNGKVLSWGADATRTGRGAPTYAAIIPTLSGIRDMQFSFTGALLSDTANNLHGYGAADDYGMNPQIAGPIASGVVQYTSGQGFYMWQLSNGQFWGRGYNPTGAIGLPIGTQTTPRLISWNLGMVAQ